MDVSFELNSDIYFHVSFMFDRCFNSILIVSLLLFTRLNVGSSRLDDVMGRKASIDFVKISLIRQLHLDRYLDTCSAAK